MAAVGRPETAAPVVRRPSAVVHSGEPGNGRSRQAHPSLSRIYAERRGFCARRGLRARATACGWSGAGVHPTRLQSHTGVWRVVGAPAACARLLRLDADHCANAVAIAANFACGLVQCYVEGTHEAVVQVAQASRNGYVAALLAEQGFVLRHEWSLC